MSSYNRNYNYNYNYNYNNYNYNYKPKFIMKKAKSLEAKISNIYISERREKAARPATRIKGKTFRRAVESKVKPNEMSVIKDFPEKKR